MSFSNRIKQRIFLEVLNQGIQKGSLHLVTPEKEKITFKGTQPGVEVHWVLYNWHAAMTILRRGDIGLGETYEQGDWDTDNLENLFSLFMENMEGFEKHASGNKINKFKFRLINSLMRRNNIKGSRQNIQSHYDVGNDFYKLWLDPTLTYSSGIYTNNSLTLQDAQRQKYQRILEHIPDGHKNILEIGCGWGGFAEEAANKGHHITGLTLSHEQHKFARNRLQNAADIRLQDYRHTKGIFDSIVSIEMFEAVGKNYWKDYFSTIKSCLSLDGVAMIQTIVIRDDLFKNYEKTSDYIRHYVFPGGFLPSLETFQQSAHTAGLICDDFYLFGKDYARTLREWLSRFESQGSAIRKLGYSDSFIRSWRLYLSMCAASFSCERTNVMQVKLTHAK